MIENSKEKIIAAGGNPERETLTVIKTKDGEKSPSFLNIKINY